MGIDRILLARGDRRAVAQAVTQGLEGLGLDGVRADLTPGQKKLLVDDLNRLQPGIKIAQHSRRIALESGVAGISLSILGMRAAANG